MPNLNLPRGGSYTPFIKYNAKQGRIFAKFESLNNEEIELVNPRFFIDMENIKTGWIFFGQTGAPIKHFDPPAGRQAMPQDGNAYKEGFEVMVAGVDKIEKARGALLGVREWCANAGVVIDAIMAMNEEYDSLIGDHPEQIPFYQFTGTNKITTQYGPIFEPVFELKGWQEREKTPFPAVAAPVDLTDQYAGQDADYPGKDPGPSSPPLEAYEGQGDPSNDPGFDNSDLPF